MTNTETLFLTAVKKSFRRSFPNGYFAFGSTPLGGSLSIAFGLIGSNDDVTNRIRENDPMFTRMFITSDGDSYYTEHLMGSLSVNPREKYLAMSSVKTKMRKSKGSLEKLETSFDKYFIKLKAIVDENKSDIYDLDKIDAKYF